jgi:RNA polymerase sigma factor (sigma-70 family)
MTNQNPGSEDRGQIARMHISSFDSFYKFYWPRLVRSLKAQASNTGWAEEVANEAMIAVWDNWDDLITYDRPDSWLFRVAIRKLRRLEAQARNYCCLDEDLASSETDLRIAAVNDEWVEDHIDLVAAMRRLPRRQGEVIGLHYFDGYTIVETAQILGVGEGTVKKHLYRARENLRHSQGVPAVQKMTRRKLA